MPPKQKAASTPVKNAVCDADVVKLRDSWKQDFNAMTDKLKDEIKGIYDKDRSMHNATIQDINKLIEKEVKSYENRWEEIFRVLDKRISALENKHIDMLDRADSLEQYNRNQSLIIHGLQESDKENSLTTAIDFLNETFDIALLQTDLVNVHRFGRQKNLEINDHLNSGNSELKTRPMIVKFARIPSRDKIFYNKKLLKGTGFSISENLTIDRLNLLRELKSLDIECWSKNGNIIVLRDKKRIHLKTLSAIKQFINEIKSVGS